MFRNVASQKLTVYAFDATTNLPKTGDAANLTAYVQKNYGVLNALINATATEISATNAKGYYQFTLDAEETDSDVLLFTCKSLTDGVVVRAVPDRVVVYPVGFSSIGVTGSNIHAVIADGTFEGILSSDAMLAQADAILTRDWTSIVVSVPSRCALQALRFIRNKWRIVAGTPDKVEIMRENDSTVAWSKEITSDTDADHVTGTGADV